MVKEFKNINGVLVDENEMAFNPECDVAIVMVSSSYTEIGKIKCDKLYNRITSYKMFFDEKLENSNDIVEHLKQFDLRTITRDYDHNRIMIEEGFSNALGSVRIIRINYQTIEKIIGNDCTVCEC